ncbi:outer membrane protein [Sphingomonas sp. BE138]|uniref:TolC family outer membrane protein n=1 Tax=Sphingomonas sp. BE138 TaxID=2817845 RepID=UPI002863D61C|nr:TolC family outer membrane protein [Sphingomonas sp. BE138]MDR6789632.1 outer membrane protein [Sphingomonas sp. BE138]
MRLRLSSLLSSVAVPLVLAGAFPAAAETLREALVRAYRDNPTLNAQRAAQRANDENVPITRAQGRPNISAQGGLTDNFLRGGNSFTTPERRLDAQLGVTVPLYQGGRVRNGVLAAETRVDAGRANLRGTEATTFTDVVSAYNNVIRDEAIVGLNTQNVRVLETNLRASRDRFEVGDLTRTDVAQSEARLSLARAQLQSAQATLISSRENYVRLVGTPPGTLEPPPPLPQLPGSPDNAVDVALQDNPNLIAARRVRDATDYDIRVARANRRPTVNATLGQNYFNFLGSLGQGSAAGLGSVQTGNASSAGVTLNVPLYQGGRPGALVRQAQELRGQAIEQATAAERQVIASARSAYAVWRSSLEVIASAEAAVNANKLSLEGVRAENSVGTRTVLDILNAEQELLNSQVTLVSARRDAYVAGFALLAAMGHAEAEDLGLDGGPLYDPTINYAKVRGKLNDFDDGRRAEPVSSSTANSVAQTAVVTRPLDPLLESNVDRTPALTTGVDTPRP